MLKLYLAEQFRLTCDERPVTGFRSKKVRALLAYLVLEEQKPISRTTLCELLWSDYMTTSAKKSLRSALSNLRKVLASADNLLQITHTTVCFDQQHPLFWCDVLEDPHCMADPSFLHDLEQVAGDAFQAWVQKQRQARAKRAETPAHNLPRRFGPIFGRTHAIQTLTYRLTSGNYPLVTLTGEGGIGKSRLAVAIGEACLQEFDKGVWFLSLVGMKPSADIASNIASHLLTLLFPTVYQQDNRVVQLLRLLQHEAWLIILDNCEPLLQTDSRDPFLHFLQQLLDQATQTVLLLTSREQLGIRTESAYPLTSLTLPPANATLLTASQAASVRMFVERAQRVYPPFTLTPTNVSLVTTICRQCGGLPLGIQLIAAQMLYEELPTIGAQLSQKLLEFADDQLPTRQQTLRTVYELSWQALSADLKHIAASCSLFNGVFSMKAASHITGATIRQLNTLWQRSLIQKTSPTRFRLHEVVRLFCAEKYQITPNSQKTTTRFVEYYFNFVIERKNAMWALRSDKAFEEVTAVLPHIVAAWEYALDQQLYTAIDNVLDALTAYYFGATNRYREYLHLLESGIGRVPTDELRLKLLDGVANCAYHLQEVEKAYTITRQLIAQAQNPILRLRAYNQLGTLQLNDGLDTEAQDNLTKGATLAEQISDDQQIAQDPEFRSVWSHIAMNLAYANMILGDHEHVSSLQEQAIALARSINHADIEGYIQLDAAYYDSYAYRYDEAIGRLQNCLEQSSTTITAKTQVQMMAELGRWYQMVGMVQLAEMWLERGATLAAKQLSSTWFEVIVWNHQTHFYIGQGRYGEATILLERTYALAQQSSGLALTETLANRALLHEALGEYEMAQRDFKTLLERTSVPTTLFSYHAGLLRIAMAENRSSLAMVEKLQQAVTAYEGFEPVKSQVILTIAQGLLKHAPSQAVDYLAQSYTQLQQQAANIHHTQMRHGFLHKNPVRRQLIALWQRTVAKANS